MQPFVNIGTESFMSNTSLEGLLFENHTYYVTLMCVNGAGLTTTNSSQGQTRDITPWYLPVVYGNMAIDTLCLTGNATILHSAK